MIRGYKDFDYEQLIELYLHKEWYGGMFDEARDGRERLAAKIAEDPNAILVYVQDGKLLGTTSIIDDGRVAWLYRFVVRKNDLKIIAELYKAAAKVLKARGHSEVLVYTPANNPVLNDRYQILGMQQGSDYTCFYKEL